MAGRKPGPAPTPKEVLRERGSWHAREARKEAKPPRRLGRKPRELSADEILSGIPGYDPRVQGEGFHYDHARALRVIRFFHDRLTLVEGARPGTRFALQPWQQALVGNLFGWVDARGLRRYRTAFLYVPKKNGKTSFAAGIALYVLRHEAANGIRCVSLAAGRDQTNNVFEPAAQMIANDRQLRGHFVVYGNSAGATNKSIVSPLNPLSTFRGLPHDADTTDGKGPWLVIGDELHRWRNGDLLDIMCKGQVSLAIRGEPVTVLTTTADYNRPSCCNQWLKRARLVRDSRGRADEPGYEPRILPVIYEGDPKADWRDPETHRKANPSYGVTVSPESLMDEVRAVSAEPSRLNDFLRFHLNVVTDTKEAALPMHHWDACPSAPPDPGVLARTACHGGLDISHKIDLTGMALWWPSLGYARWWFWIPREGMIAAEQRDGVPYSTWARLGFVDVIDGSAIDHDWLREQIYSICSGFKVVDIGYDPWNCDDVGMWLAAKGLPTVRMRQGHQTLGGPSKALEAAVVSHSLNHGGNPVARWNAGNLAWRRDPNGNICPEKGDRPNLRIDGMVALVMAMGRATAQPAPRRSSYEGRRMVV